MPVACLSTILYDCKIRDNNNTQIAAVALLPSTMHPLPWAEPHTQEHTHAHTHVRSEKKKHRPPFLYPYTSNYLFDIPLHASDGDGGACVAVVHVVVSLQLPDVGLAWLRMEHAKKHVDGRLLVCI